MPKQSAGLLVYRFVSVVLEVLLVHPGGPFYAKKDEGVWSIPKGEYASPEEPLDVAKREFTEETGNTITATNFIALSPVQLKSGKIITAWAVAADFDPPFISSNDFEMEWPPKSGKLQRFPEADKAEWMTIEKAMKKIHPAQTSFLLQLQQMIISG